jgi:hypothetical protein
MTAITGKSVSLVERSASWNLERLVLVGSLTVGIIVGMF